MIVWINLRYSCGRSDRSLEDWKW